MAQMYPDTPRECTDSSLEKEMFDALEGLTDDYYIFHSFSIVKVIDDTLYESETDFVIFHPQKGIICIEAKAGAISYEAGEWKYGSGLSMNHDGPYNQASQNKWKLKKYIEDRGLAYLLDKCKLIHAVWFPSVSREYMNTIAFPPEADKKITLTKESLENIQEEVDRLFDIEVPRNIRTSMTTREVDILMRKALAPSFNLINLSEVKSMHRERVFKSMLKEQIALLDYLEEQNTAVINGMAGTGKTVMAVEKARRHADLGEKVLFLCYNTKLKDYLKETFNHEKIDFYTIPGLACKLCGTEEADYSLLDDILLEFFTNKNFPWKHVIIDEGQDFGQQEIEELSIIDTLRQIVVDSPESDGSFYMFYDLNQFVQGVKIPEYITEADCKLTLYRNCRNTESIAITSNRMLGRNKKPILRTNSIYGNSPELYVINDKESYIETVNRSLDSIIDKDDCESVVLITGISELSSPMTSYCKDGIYKYKGHNILFTTYRKYKGLEADGIVFIDVNKGLLDPDNAASEKALYVGTSRARYELCLICDITEDDGREILSKYNIDNSKANRKPIKALATALNAIYMEKKE